MIYQNSTIGELVRSMETDFISGTTQTSKYVYESLYEDISKIEAYLNSKHISGDTDALGRDKPFFNIVRAARNIWFRATDIDRKDIRIKATKSQDYLPSFLASIKLQDWMRRENFGAFLNDWGLTLASYNSSVVKFVESEGKLHAVVVPWTRIICDQVDFGANPKIEILELTPAQLRRRKGYDQEIVRKLIDTLESRKNTDKTNKDQKTEYIRLYEIHGELPKSYLTGKPEDEDDFVQQMHVISFVQGKENGEYDDFTLVSGKEEKDPYMLTALMPEIDGSISLNGAVKQLFEAQWMMNHTVKGIKDQLDLASKLIFQTSDGNFVGQNALSAIESGDILIHKPNEPLTQLQNNSHDIASLQNFGQQWKVLAQEITSTPDILMGQNMPSGTAYRQAAIIQQESHSNFEIMTENKGLYIERMLREHIIPYLKKHLDSTEEISATLDSHDLARVDRAYISHKAIDKVNQEAIESVLRGEVPEGLDVDSAMMEVQGELAPLGNQRFFKPSEIEGKKWKDVFRDLEWDVEINITGEPENKQVVMDTLTTVMGTIGNNPAVLQDPNMRLLFNKILETTGIVSPLEINSVGSAPQVGSTQVTQATPQAETPTL